ncbi:hypothetical protein OAE63_01420 [bacterium]|nr:hypothetical protein [bacterium]
MAFQQGGGKLPGKSEFSGRRRSTTRKAAFKSHEDSTGGEYRVENAAAYSLAKDDVLSLKFFIPKHLAGVYVGYGGWFYADGAIDVKVVGGPKKKTLKQYDAPSWSKFGSLWISQDGLPLEIQVTFTASRRSQIAFFEVGSGAIFHEHLETQLGIDDSRSQRLLSNMHIFAPEANFYSEPGKLRCTPSLKTLTQAESDIEIALKSCNRCARFLPINRGGANERNQLSFSNHCVAPHRRPCRHGGFGKLRNVDNDEVVLMEYGFQLECRFCKKFEVNAEHNPQRTGAQMKEDAARRRGFELLMEALEGGSPQLLYRHKCGRELADDVWERFGKKCFKCSSPLATVKEMNLDHTRPLALLWPLDETATALCKNCNSEKRDRPPSEYYKPAELRRLADMCNLSEADLQNPSPNLSVLEKLEASIDWLFETFLSTAEMTKVRDGKVTGELIVKALHKVDSSRPGGPRLNLLAEYDRRRQS